MDIEEEFNYDSCSNEEKDLAEERDQGYNEDPHDSQNKSTIIRTTNTTSASLSADECTVSSDTQLHNKLKKKRLRRVKVSLIDMPRGIEAGMKLFGDISISNDGVLRLCSALSNVSFGYQEMVTEKVEFLKKQQLFNIQFKHGTNLPKCSFNDAIMYLSRANYSKGVGDLLHQMGSIVGYIKEEISQFAVTQQMLLQKKHEFEEFTKFCFEYLKIHYNYDREGQFEGNQNIENESIAYNSTLLTGFDQDSKYFEAFQESAKTSEQRQQQPVQMYSYAIGKINLQEKDFDVIYAGYSTGYMELLGIDYDSFVQMAMRQKRVDLIQDKREITQQSAKGLFYRILRNPNIELESKILTFDGFPLKLHQRSHKVFQPGQPPVCYSLESGFMFAIVEIDVDVVDLQNLIKYREQILHNSQGMSADNFISKELSYRFEDVEYSIHSESFLEKYYSENIAALKKQQQQKQIIPQPCRYRILNEGELPNCALKQQVIIASS